MMHALLKSYAHTGDECWLGRTSIALRTFSAGPDVGANDPSFYISRRGARLAARPVTGCRSRPALWLCLR
jgi:hypothetical protein